MLNGFVPHETWFTADLHFWHAAMPSERFELEHRRSRWRCVEEMNVELIQEWRDTVGPHDIVYHVGDLFHRCGVEKVRQLLRDLSGHWIFLLPGNHDEEKLSKLARRGELPTNVRLLPPEVVMLDRPILGRDVVMHHYPPDRCPKFDTLGSDTLLLHGHSHGRGVAHPRAIDVGWDAHQRFLRYHDLVEHFGGVLDEGTRT